MSIENEYEGRVALVTGGAGCIGTNLCRKLAELGARKVIILDDLSSTNGMSQSSIWQLIRKPVMKRLERELQECLHRVGCN